MMWMLRGFKQEINWVRPVQTIDDWKWLLKLHCDEILQNAWCFTVVEFCCRSCRICCIANTVINTIDTALQSQTPIYQFTCTFPTCERQHNLHFQARKLFTPSFPVLPLAAKNGSVSMEPVGIRKEPVTQTCCSICSKSTRQNYRIYASWDPKSPKEPSYRCSTHLRWYPPTVGCATLRIVYAHALMSKTYRSERTSNMNLQVSKCLSCLYICSPDSLKNGLLSFCLAAPLSFLIANLTRRSLCFGFCILPTRDSFETSYLALFSLEDGNIQDTQEHIQCFAFVLHEFGKSLENFVAFVWDSCSTIKSIGKNSKILYMGCAFHYVPSFCDIESVLSQLSRNQRNSQFDHQCVDLLY